MITLYQFASSPFTEKVRRALNYKGIAFEVHEVDRLKAGELSAVSPFGKFPAMDHDGTAVCDSTDIVLHLEEKFPERPLIPGDPAQAAQVHVLEDWADESLYHYEICMRISWEHNAKHTVKKMMDTMPAGFTEEQVLEIMLANSRNITEAQGLGRKTREQVAADAARHARALEAMLEGREWLVGDSLTLADIAVLPQVNCLMFAEEFDKVAGDCPNLQAWMQRVDAAAPAITADQ